MNTLADYFRQIGRPDLAETVAPHMANSPEHMQGLDAYRHAQGHDLGISLEDAQGRVGGYFQGLLGRAPTSPEMERLANPMAAGHGNPYDALAYARMLRDIGDRPAVPGFEGYQNAARLSTAGMNRMPFVFSDFGGMMGGQDVFGRMPQTANMANQAALFRPATEGMQNPILAGTTPPQPQQQPAANPVLQQPEQQSGPGMGGLLGMGNVGGFINAF